MLNLMVMFICPVMDQKLPFCANLVWKSKIFIFRTRKYCFGLRLRWNFCHVLDWKYPFRKLCSRKSKLAKMRFGALTNSNMLTNFLLIWNFVSRLIQICWIWSLSSLMVIINYVSSFGLENTLSRQICCKNSKLSV